MSAGPSLYRRHRPRTFSDVVGQAHVVRTLRNAVERDRVHHAYLFVGSRGTGKTSMAKILASCLNCERGPTIEPCGVCDSCVAIANASSLDVIEMDAASNNSVDDIRELRDKVAYAPVSGRNKVYILDEAHMLSSQAWNAFLKTLEEPPPHTIFVLATTEANRVLPTVVDRCHRFDFTRPTVEEIAGVLRRVADQESIGIPDAALALVARHATGSFRDALGTLEQLTTYGGGGDGAEITVEEVLAVLGVADAEALFGALDAVASHDARAAMLAVARLVDGGRDPGQLVRELEAHARELLAVQVLGGVPAELRLTPERDERLAAQAAALGRQDVVRLLDLLSDALEALANGAQARIQLELALVRAAAPEVDPSTRALLARIDRLEARLAAGGAAAPASAVVAAPAAPELPAAPQPSVPASSAAAPVEPVPAQPASTPAPSTAAAGPAANAPVAPTPTTPTASMPAAPPVDAAPADPPGPNGFAPHAEPAPAPSAPEPDLPRPATAAAQATAEPAEPATSVAAAEPVAPPPASAGELTLDLLRELWPAAVDAVRSENALLAAAIAEARPIAAEQGEVVLALPTGKAFARRMADSEDNRRHLAEALRSLVGVAVRPRYELRDPDPADAAAENGAGGTTATNGAPALSDDELVARFMAEFDAEELIEDDEEGGS